MLPNKYFRDIFKCIDNIQELTTVQYVLRDILILEFKSRLELLKILDNEKRLFTEEQGSDN